MCILAKLDNSARFVSLYPHVESIAIWHAACVCRKGRTLMQSQILKLGGSQNVFKFYEFLNTVYGYAFWEAFFPLSLLFGD